MHPTLHHYVTTVRGVLDAPLSPSARVRRIRAAAKELVERGLPLTAEQRQVPEGGYGRNLLYRDPDHGFVVIAMVWPPGCGGAPHDHGTWGVVAVTEGRVHITNYVREDDGSQPGKASLHKVGTIEGTPGTVGYVLPPHEDVHEIKNGSADEVSVSVHTYGCDIRRCTVFDPKTGAARIEELGYS